MLARWKSQQQRARPEDGNYRGTAGDRCMRYGGLEYLKAQGDKVRTDHQVPQFRIEGITNTHTLSFELDAPVGKPAHPLFGVNV